ncbi:hypothetical protein GC176_28265 [bacterium]|nr:hypothetical protein [bacterium]
MLDFGSLFAVSQRGTSRYFQSLERGRQRRLRWKQQRKWELRLIESLEDRSLLTVVDFSGMIAEVTATSDDGDVITAHLQGSASVDIADTPTQTGDGRDTVQTEIVAMSLQGFDSYNGPLDVRVSSVTPSLGAATERRDVVGGQVDTAFNVDSFFDVNLEIEAFVDDPMDPMNEVQVTLYGVATIATGTAGGRDVPVAPGDTMSLVAPFDLFLDADETMPAGFTVEQLDLTFEANFTAISGQKWDDLNGNGVKDADEPGLDNWIIVAFDVETDTPVEAQVTRSIDLDMSGTIDPETESGLYEFTNLPPGYYFITEMQQTGWGQTFPQNIPAGELPQFGPGDDWLQFVRQGNDFLGVGMLATFDWDNDGTGDETVFVQGNAGSVTGDYNGGSTSVATEIERFDLYGNSSRGPVHIVTGDSNANLTNDGPLYLGGSYTQDPMDPALADSFFDIFVELDVGNTLGGGGPPADTVWTNSTPIHVEASVDRLPAIGQPYHMTNASPVPFFDNVMVQQAQLVDLRFTTFRLELFQETVGYYYTVTQGQQISNVSFGNQDFALGPFGVDYGDAPDPAYPTLAANNGANHVIDGKHFLGQRVDAESNGQPNAFATGDDLADPAFSIRSDDEDGVLFLDPLVTGQTADITVEGSRLATQQMLLSGWIDWNGNGDWSDAGDQVFTDVAINPGSNSLSINVPAGATTGVTYARFRVSTQSGLSFTGSAPNGEVEDYSLVIYPSDPPTLDWGDAPDPLDATAGQYPTLAANNGAYHLIDGVTVIGNFISGEADGQPNVEAKGDLVHGVYDNEDGIVVVQPLAVGDDGVIAINTLTGGFLNAWIDFNADGDWNDANEQIAMDLPVGPGRNRVFVDVPPVADGVHLGQTFARFRLSPNAGEVSAPTGPAVNPMNPGGVGYGEVEDVSLTIYHGELIAEGTDWEVAVHPQEVPPAINESNPGPVGITTFQSGPEIGQSVGLLNQGWYWFAIDGGAPQRLDTLTLVDASDQYANPLTLTYGDAANGDPIQVALTLTLNETSTSEAAYTTTVAITNLTGSPIDLDFFSYTDATLNGSLGRLDRATVVSATQIDVNGVTGSSVSHQITGTAPDHYQIGTVGSNGTAFAFQSGTLTDLTDSPAVSSTTAPGNVAHAFQWSRTVAAAGTLTLEASHDGVAVPVELPQQFAGGSIRLGIDPNGGGEGDGTGPGGSGGSAGFGGSSAPPTGNPKGFDPAFAIGYDFVAQVNRFSTVELPTGVGGDQYTLSYLDDLAQEQTVSLMGGVEFDFNSDPNVANGVDAFRVLDIESSEMIDVVDPLGFVTLLSFVSAGPYSHTQTGIPEFIYVAAGAGELREDVNLGSLQGVLETGDEGTWLPGTEHEENGLTYGFTLFNSLTAAQNRIATAGYTGLTTIVTPPVDYGDAPDTGAGTGAGNYQTTQADGGPSHAIVSTLFLGASVDSDDGTLQNAQANADDVDGALPDDENGVLNPLDLRSTIGAAPTITLLATNTTGSEATLSGWIDFNSDGVFDNATERAQIAVPDGTIDGRLTLTFPTIPEGFTGTTYARFRLSTDAAGQDSTGAASDGEVEDYTFSITAPGSGTVNSFLKIASGTNGGPALSDRDGFGSSVAVVGDLDGDGVSDLAVGAYTDDTGGGNRGAVHILLMNPDGTVKSSTKIAHELNGGPTLANGDFFGNSVTGLGDLDGDGVPDLAVGAYLDDTGGFLRGAVYVLLLNSDGTAKSSTKIAHELNGGPTLANSDFFGNSVSGVGDLDGDGVPDLAVGAYSDATGGDYRGAVHVLLLNPDGTVKSSTKIASGLNGGPMLADRDYFGLSISGVGDLDGDGVADLAVGARRDGLSGSDHGAVHVLLLNAEGTVKSSTKIGHELNGGPTLADGDSFGRSISGAGDLDGDGVPDLVVGAYGDDTGGDLRGAVHVLLLNADGTVKSSTKIASDISGGPTLANLDEFGFSVSGVGDRNGDGVADLAVGAIRDDTGGDNRGAVYVLFLNEPVPPTDYGDAPDGGAGTGTGGYQTTAADNGPSHLIVDGLHLGASVDADDGTLQNAAANADDIDGALPDDENGVLNPFDLQGTAGAAPTVTLLATNTTGSAATLYGWIDYNQDGVFDNATERVSIVVPDGSSAVRFTLTFPTIPAGFSGATYARFRLSTDAAAANSTGAASDGEVEDYAFSINSPADSTAGSVVKIAHETNGGPTLANYDAFGNAIAAIGDLDGDGVADVAVGARNDSSVGQGQGAIHVLFMNSDGSVKSSMTIASGVNGGPTLANGDGFGSSLAAIGDLDGDGIAELAVGADFDSQIGGVNSRRGSVHILFLNSDGTVRTSTKIADSTNGGPALADADRFGSAVSSLGDLDGDGVPDIAVGAMGDGVDGSGEVNRGAVHVLFLNTDGSVKSSAKIGSGMGGGPMLGDDDHFGCSLAVLPDLDGDGIVDLAVGAYLDSASGAVHVLHLKADGSVSSSIRIANGVNGGPSLTGFDRFGVSVTSAGDLDGDGIADLVVGANGDDTGGSDSFANRGAIYALLLNSDGSAKSSAKIAHQTGGGPTLSNYDFFGASVASIGDLDGDGVVDLAVGADGDDTGGSANYSDRGAVHVLFLAPALTAGPVDVTLPGAGEYHIFRDGAEIVVLDISGPELLRGTAALVSVLRIEGSAGDDIVVVLDSGVAVDTPIVFTGNDGNDFFSASTATGPVNLTGNGGNDTLGGGSANDTLNGGSGSDNLIGGLGDDLLRGQGSTGDTLHGSDGDDTLDGGSGNDVIYEVFDGDATLTNSVMTGRGNDTVISAERAVLQGSGVSAGQRFDLTAFFTAGLTSSTVVGSGGDDTILATDGSDVINGAGGSDVVDGRGGNDRLFGGSGADTLLGGAGDDLLKGLGGTGDRLSGGDGNDTLNGGRGVDRVFETGDVDFTLTNSSLTGLGTDVIQAIEVAELNGGPSDNVIDVSTFSGFKGFTLLRGNGGNDSIIGSAMNDVINGGDGNDTLLGKVGNDTLNGEDGNDGLSGADGDDVLDGGRGYDIGFGGMGNDSLAGGNAVDTLIGGDGDDTLAGNDGTDTLVGGTGNNDPSAGDVFNDATANIDEAFMLDPLPAWVDQV